MISNRSWRLLLPSLAAAVLFILPAHGQSASPSATSSAQASTVNTGYDVAKEIKIEGAIEKIDAASTNAPMGTHILVQTPQGVVDAHLGFGAAAKPSRLGIAEGQNVTIVGMMETVGSNQVMLARLMTTPDHIFVLRNEHGIPARGVPTKSHISTVTQKGGL
jgi:hypothetical protein